MMKKAMKYGIMIIAAVLVIAMAFAGAASATDITSDNWNTQTITSGSYKITDGSAKIVPKNLGTSQLTLTGDLTLDFSGYTKGFDGHSGSESNVGALLGNVSLGTHKLEIIGLNMTSVRVSSSGKFIGGVIGKVADSGTLNFTNCNILNCSINGTMSGSNNVGGLVGNAGSANVNVENCKALHCDVVAGSSNVGGLVGRADSVVRFVGCNVTNSTVASTGEYYVGGLVGNAGSASFTTCGVENTSVFAKSNSAGGLVGSGSLAISSSTFMDGCNVKNCVVVAGQNNVGGLVGHTSNAVDGGIKNCHVVDCTFVSTKNGGGVSQVGGLVGYAYSTGGTHSDNSVESCAVKGTGTSVNLICGTGQILGCTADLGKNFICNGTYTDTILLYNAAGSSCALDGNFWHSISYTDGDPGVRSPAPSMGIVTNIGEYGKVGGYGVGSYNDVPPGPTPVTYPIWITNASGTYRLSDAMTKVYGDTGIGSGYANLTGVDEATGTYTLELNNFNASNMTGNVPIIKADVANLTIVLKGNSNLMGSLNANTQGVLNTSGNLMITKEGEGTLLVNNNAGSSGNAVYAENDVTINDGTVNATGPFGAIYANTGNITIEAGTVNAKATGSDGKAICAVSGNVAITGGTINANGFYYAIGASNDLTIGGGTVNANGNNYAIATMNADVTIGGGTVNASVTGTNGKAIYAVFGNVTINDGTVNATATGGNGVAIYANKDVTIEKGTITATATKSYVIYANNDVTINDGTVTLTGSSVIYANYDVTIGGGTINATATGDLGGAIQTNYGNVTINAGTINATATGADGSAIKARNGCITIASVDQLIANATDSFVYNTARDFSALGDNYEYWVNSTGSALPLIKLNYEQFNATENWTTSFPYKSVYTHVLIKKPVAPTPVYHSSSSRQTGSTVILQPGQVAPTQVPTVAPTVKPTAAPTEIPGGQTTVVPTVKPTAQPTQTQASPAPILGLIAGLGIAGLVLRLRK